jgi:hypothetical protein
MLDPRDRALERLLQAGGTRAGGSAECLDAETAAAWADGGLEAPALARAEAHVSSCARCQAVVATLVQVPADAAAAAPSTARQPRSWWQFDVRWLVPLAGAATAALLWMVVPRGPAASPPIAEEKAESSVDGTAAVPGADKAPPNVGAREEDRATQPGARSNSATALADRRAARSREMADQTSPDSAADRFAKTEPSAALEAPAAVAAAPPAPAVVAAAPPPAADSRNEALAKQTAPGAPSVAGLSADAGRTLSRQPSEAPPLAIASRDAPVRWRVGADAVVERSIDSGATWVPTELLPGAALAGASPSAAVCWLVGRGGLVMLTTDARTWRILPAPVADDLVAVEAADDRRATVRTATGSSFQTTDAGGTWRRTPGH